jgi:membrane fusion protein (multidrug efflux system)
MGVSWGFPHVFVISTGRFCIMSTFKSLGVAAAGILGIVLLIGGMKGAQVYAMIESGKSFVPPPESISTFTVETQTWPNVFSALGTVEADEGVIISAQVAGKVQRIAFTSGAQVEAGTILIEQESGNEQAQLRAATARLKLALSSFERIEQLREKNSASQSELDTAFQQKESAQADVEDLKATLAKKIVRAPFSGRLGIRQVDLGKDLLVGAPIVSLQATNRVRVNFSVPQHWLVKMNKGQDVEVRVGDGSNHVVNGLITAIGAEINTATRNAVVQSSLENAGHQLIPGMAVETRVTLTDPLTVLAVPGTAILHAPFGDTVFIIEKDGESSQLKARQQFVRLGKSLGDFIEIVDGLKPGDVVASAGGFKLYNGQSVIVSESPSPSYSLSPTPEDT